jgi:hypothetical protein
MHFRLKNTLKSNHYHTYKHLFLFIRCGPRKFKPQLGPGRAQTEINQTQANVQSLAKVTFSASFP